MTDSTKVTRRDFLGFMIFAIGGIISFALGIPAIAYIVGPALKIRDEQNWIPLGAASKVEIGVPTLFQTNVQQKSGWIVEERELRFYVYSEDGREFIAMSNVCTHLGCSVRWVAEQTQFFCPCHNGVFDKNGKVVAGPPPRPLDRFEIKEEDGQLFVLGG